MKKILSCILSVLILGFSFPLFAASHQYIIMIDAGSSSSRAHIFAYTPSSPVPQIKDVFNQSSKPSLSTFADHPSDAGPSLKPILDACVQQLNSMGVNASEVPVRVFATAGMRLLSDAQQNAIYDNVRSYIRSQYAFILKDQDVQTISGVMEGVYDWLDINYLLNQFLNPPVTSGIIDMGGASTQIAFATTDNSMTGNEISVDINHTHYTVFSQSFLGLGQDAARRAVSADLSATSCYPQGYNGTFGVGQFNFATCSSIYTKIINNHQVTQQMISPTGQNFIAFSGIFFNYQFFSSLNNPTQANFDTQIQNTCNRPWSTLQANSNDPYLPFFCTDGVYFDNLLYGVYQLQGAQLTVASQINGTGIDWTLGALLYSLL